eukprot:CAMPEP_0114590802 /NCGR_PEP_ID=MMETSP0125-20121206/12987_1 /TAXON_ID=485358 ORGANISM="Aristerostoma sp., Strain ATCC 50986" /NCGR_SAMPLE_ID=MMETSP0125 /ASSEMBLY_ACC=CAM_ASM_000245 /LENGTH=76 /DNA_ID=CAMNT_0001788527 /DNA_START=88 /DNA_END=318 /DNA_ORIENTATION=-
MSDIDELKDEISGLLATVEKDLKAIDGKEPSQKQKSFDKCSNRLADAKVKLETFSNEIFELDKAQRAQYKEVRNEL